MIINIIGCVLILVLLIAMVSIHLVIGLSNNLAERARLSGIFWVLVGLFSSVALGMIIRGFME